MSSPRKIFLIEFLTWIGVVGVQAILFRHLLRGETSFVGDAFNFGYPYFSYFADTLMKGKFPYWDPFTHGGHPFFPMIGIFRLLDPVTIMVITIGKYFTKNLLVLFNWNVLVMGLTCEFGIYLLFRRLFSNLFCRLLLIPVLVFSSITFSSFWHLAGLFFFVWVPYILIYLNRIFIEGKSSWTNWLLLALFLGLQSQGYFAASVFLLLLFYFIGLLIFHRSIVCELLFNQTHRFKVFAFLLLLVALVCQTAVLIFEADKFIFPYRLNLDEFMSSTFLDLPEKVSMPYDYLTKTGAFSNPWNFLWLVYPNWWGHPSEVFLSLGALTWFISMVGICFARHSQKMIWGCLLVGFGLIIMGPSGGLHQLLFYIYPPVRTIRHLMELTNIFALALIYFFVIGSNFIYSLWHREFEFQLRSSEFSWSFGLSAYLLFALNYLLGLEFPNKAFVYFLVGTTLSMFILKERIGKMGGFVTAILVPIGSCLLFVPNKKSFVVQLALLVFVPALAFFVLRRLHWKYKGAILATLVIASIFAATTLHLHYFKQVYTLKPAVSIYGGKMFADNVPLELTRTVSPFGELIPHDEVFTVPALTTRSISLFNHNSTASVSEGLKKRILTHFVMFKDCFRLLRSGLAPETIAEVFAIDKPVFQFKERALQMETKNTRLFLKEIKSDKVAEVLNNQFISNDDQNPKIARDASDRAAANSQVKVTSYQPGEALLSVESNREGYLYWADGYDSWWKATVNGRPVKILRANLNFKAVAIGAGKSGVRFTYDPVYYRYSLYLYWTTLLGVVGFAFGNFLLTRFELKLLLRPFRKFSKSFIPKIIGRPEVNDF